MKNVKNTRDYRQQTVKMDLQSMLESYVSDKAKEHRAASYDRQQSINERVSDFIRLVYPSDNDSRLHTRYYTLYNELKEGLR